MNIPKERLTNKYVNAKLLSEKIDCPFLDTWGDDEIIPFCTNVETLYCIRCKNEKLKDSWVKEKVLIRYYECGHAQLHKLGVVYPFELKQHKGPLLTRIVSTLNLLEHDKEMTENLLTAIFLELKFPPDPLIIKTYLLNRDPVAAVNFYKREHDEKTILALKALLILNDPECPEASDKYEEMEISGPLLPDLKKRDIDLDQFIKQYNYKYNHLIVRLGEDVDVCMRDYLKEFEGTDNDKLPEKYFEKNQDLILQLCTYYKLDLPDDLKNEIEYPYEILVILDSANN